MAESAKASAARAIAHIELAATLQCCGGKAVDVDSDTSIAAASGGAQFARITCDRCGSEYMLGLIARTREESLASEVFESLTADEEEKAGIDRTDYEPSAEEPAMCAGCDGNVQRGADYCQGCKEFVCRANEACRKYEPRRNPHPVEAHWTAPKKAATTDMYADADSTDFVAEDRD